jgi:hypothetical protein
MVEPGPGLEAPEVVGVEDAAPVEGIERDRAVADRRLRSDPVERVIGVGQRRGVAPGEQGAVAVGVVFVIFMVARVDAAGAGERRRLAGIVVRSGPGGARERPPVLAAVAIVTKLGAVPIAVDDRRDLAVGAIGPGRFGASSLTTPTASRTCTRSLAALIWRPGVSYVRKEDDFLGMLPALFANWV